MDAGAELVGSHVDLLRLRSRPFQLHGSAHRADRGHVDGCSGGLPGRGVLRALFLLSATHKNQGQAGQTRQAGPETSFHCVIPPLLLEQIFNRIFSRRSATPPAPTSGSLPRVCVRTQKELLQRLKPPSFCASYGTAKAVPSCKTVVVTQTQFPAPAAAEVRPRSARCSSGVSWNMYRTRRSAWSLPYPWKLAGKAPANTQRSSSRRNKPEGIAVPGMILAGSVIQRTVQAGFSRSRASRKFGADAFLSCAESPVAWHFRHGAVLLVKSWRAISRSAVVNNSCFGAIYGLCCALSAAKKRTSFWISSSEKLNVGMRTCKYERTPLRFVSVALSAGFARKRISQAGSTRAPSLVNTGGRLALFSPWYIGSVCKALFSPTAIWWHPIQLYFVTIHQPS